VLSRRFLTVGTTIFQAGPEPADELPDTTQAELRTWP